MKIVLFKTIFIAICIVPIILLIIAITDYAKNDETKVVWIDMVEKIHTEDDIYIKDNSGYYTVHSNSQFLLNLMIFFSWIYPVIIYYSAPILYIDKKGIFYKLFFYFSLVMVALTWIIIIYDSDGKIIGPNRGYEYFNN